ncbi:RNA 2',3'-cyclic phosphodiesterase [Candidatus Parcubacteria bacterium]|jgi:RNA 2',3'-cyclic 3'-phosphodiesterase|nr:RNA 2',3'-cyclic phosphodiesterase [Candidatus Parcubacteria bacterium]MBT3948516.1 RNA 2',3'-cyclic phosphodiesterase [Candidatus Parcubacteria bacterium]
MGKIRTFIAFRVSDEVKGELKHVQDELQKKNKKAHVMWSKSRGFHVTVQFLGEIEEFEIEQVKEALLDIANTHHAFKYWIDRLDGFPNPVHPKIITMRCEEEKHAGDAINKDFVKKLKELNLVHDDKPWKPHITLGRNRGDALIQGFDTIKFEKKTWLVDTIELIKSDPKPGGSGYTILESFELKKI